MSAHDKNGDKWVEMKILDKMIALHLGRVPLDFRKIISSKTYSSRTMTKVAEYEPENIEIFDAKVEILFQTRMGGFLLVGCGNACTPWAVKHAECNETYRGHGFLPLTSDEAQEWLELRGLDESYVELFGAPGDEPEISNEILLRLPPTLARRINAAASADKMPVQQWIQVKLTEAAVR